MDYSVCQPTSVSSFVCCFAIVWVSQALGCCAGPNRAIVVGNAQPDLKQWVAQQKNGRDSSRLWMSSKPEALGILEGLEHFGFN